MMRPEKRIAVFVSGPVRYASLVRERVTSLLAPYNPAFFFHLWNTDLGNKVREGYESDWSDLIAHDNTKLCLLHQPYDKAFYEKLLGSEVNTHSTINAILGMFLALGQLVSLFRTLPDRESFTHILRIRTDCALTSNQIANFFDWDLQTVTLSSDPCLPNKGWACDHLLFAPADLFLRIYDLTDIAALYEVFEKGRRNPEKMMRYLLETRLPAGTRIVETIERFRHYQLVYSPPRPGDSAWVKALVKEGRIRELFLEPEKFRDAEEDEATAIDQAYRGPANYDPYGNFWINKLRHLVYKILRK